MFVILREIECGRGFSSMIFAGNCEIPHFIFYHKMGDGALVGKLLLIVRNTVFSGLFDKVYKTSLSTRRQFIDFFGIRMMSFLFPAFLFLPETVGRDDPFGDCRFGFDQTRCIICLGWFCPARAGEPGSRMAPRQQQGSADKE